MPQSTLKDECMMNSNEELIECSKLDEQCNLPLFQMTNEHRIKHLESQLHTFTIDMERNILNTYKNLLKLKWFQSNDERFVEGLIFNDKTTYVKYLKFKTTDSNITEKLWQELSGACENPC